METPKIIYVQAHGGGSERLTNKFMTYNQYRKKIGEPEIIGNRPYILRISASRKIRFY